MSSALNQLIAQQQGPNIMGSAMQGLAAADQYKADQQNAELKKQQISLAQKQLANSDRDYAAKKLEQESQHVAGVAYQIKKAKTPEEANGIYQQALSAAKASGEDISAYPPTLDDKAMQILDYHFGKVYGDEQFKTDEKIREQQAKPQDLPNEVREASYMGIDLKTPQGRQEWADFKKSQLRPAASGGGEGGDGYHPPLNTSTGIMEWDAKARKYAPMVNPEGKPYLPLGADAGVQSDVAAGKAGGKAKGEAQGTASVQYGQMANNVAEIDKQIGALASHKGLSGIVGVRGAIPNIPGTDAADAQARLEQLQGGVFMQARQALKGGGQITDYEGMKAEQAYGRMQKAQSKEAFLEALGDYQTHIHNGLKLLAEQSKGEFAGAGQEPTPPATPKQPQLTADDQAAINWAKSNPNDPRASAIMQLHGVR